MLLDNGYRLIRRWLGVHVQIAGAALLLGCFVLIAHPAQAQTTPPAASTIRVLVDGKPPLTLDRSALAAMPRTSIDTAAIHHEPATHWQGVTLEEVLQRAGAVSGEQLRGKSMSTVVRVSAADHYQVVFSLGELDPLLGNEQVLLADTQDGQPLSKNGPFRLVVPGDKRPARWIHSVTTIEVTRSAATP
ncbi:molybdopterin-dependent oxidoreductase [Dyella acidiphila]|uniref:Molybdopterin-dependent oxidoreductase n=1 Tax=Dyella acidiphila TaxID=2775866 RepID=A0ABR9G8H3_9GAMM|nr:molybdopterin-dependent oxidoreductase [Dyella acidiphila]MBE1160314.1 molybdopterin-dependent oxidoreductase [Dyella acidiphila]